MPNNVNLDTRNLDEKLTEIVQRTCDSAIKLVNYNVQVPEGFVRESVQEPQNVDASPKNHSGLIAKLASIIFPAMFVFLGLIFQAELKLQSIAIVVILAGIGGILGSLVPLSREKDSVENSNLNLTTRQKLRREDIKVQLVANDEAELKFLSEVRPEIEKLVQDIAETTKVEEIKIPQSNEFLNRSFGEWAQRFLIYADSQPNDRKIQRMRYDFVTELSLMGVTVYDELELDAEGKPAVPFPVSDYLIFDPTIKNFTKVERPAIYSKNQILVRGEIS